MTQEEGRDSISQKNGTRAKVQVPEKGAPGAEEMEDPHFESKTDFSKTLLASGGFCPTQLSVLRGFSGSSGLTFWMGEDRMLGEAGRQLCFTAGQLLFSCC